MKALNLQEIEQIVQTLKPLRGSRLQEIRFAPPLFAWYFYGQGKGHWLVVDLIPQRPIMFLGDDINLPKKSKTSPTLLFARAHLLGKKLENVNFQPQLGRVVGIQVGDASIELRLFPHGQNLILCCGDKKISLKPIKELSPQQTEYSAQKVRSPLEIYEEWKRQTKPKPKTLGNDPEKQRQREMQKALKTMQKLEQVLAEDTSQELYQLAEWLQLEQSLQVPQKWQVWINNDLSLGENIDAIFEKAKAKKMKMAKTQERLQLLKSQLAKMEKGEWSPPERIQKKNNLLKKTQSKGSGIPLDEACQVYVGKSAGDNIALLKKSQPWDLWLHLKDFPGTHAIIRRPRKRQVSDFLLKKAAIFLAKKSAHFKSGDHFEVLVTESRYVRPIKGDKLGRVHYQNERVIRATME